MFCRCERRHACGAERCVEVRPGAAARGAAYGPARVQRPGSRSAMTILMGMGKRKTRL